MIKKLKRIIKRIYLAKRDLRRFKEDLKVNTNEKNIIFISHNADSNGGAPVVLYDLAQYLKKEEKVLFLTGKPGGLYNDKLKMYLMEIFYKKYLKYLNKDNTKYILVNTILGYKYINELEKKDIPIIWWIHEENRIIEKFSKKIQKIKYKNNIKVMCVSPQVKEEFEKVRKDFNCEIMFYGIEDKINEIRNKKKKEDGKFIISVIGRICERKNQLQVIEAVNMINDTNIRNKIQINFVAGSKEDKYYEKIKKYFNKNITIIGPIERKKMIDIYANTDLVVCCSNNDPLPVVITEAMMYKRLFITSSETGQAKIINNEVNGIVYDINNIGELKEEIIKCFNDEYGDSIIDGARKLYEDNFKFSVLEEKISEAINNE